MTDECEGPWRLREKLPKNSESTGTKLSPSKTVILKWVRRLSVHYRTELSETEQNIYLEELGEFAPSRIDVGFHRALHDCEYIPRVADIVTRMPEADFLSTAEPDTGTPANDFERQAITNSILELGKSLGKHSRFEGQHWTAEHGWMPVSGKIADEKPELNRTDSRPSAQWSPEETEEYMSARGFMKVGNAWIKKGASS
jgi:hypothetical protein